MNTSTLNDSLAWAWISGCRDALSDNPDLSNCYDIITGAETLLAVVVSDESDIAQALRSLVGYAKQRGCRALVHSS